MRHIPPRVALTITLLIFAVVYASLSVASAQTVHTSTLTQITNISLTNTILSTTTSQIVGYTTTTETLNSTISATQTQMQLSQTTATITYTTTVTGSVTQTVSAIVTEVSTETTQLLGNLWGESLAVVLVLGACMSLLVPRARSRRPRGLVCSKCGTRNPPFAKAFCVKCGQSLRKK